MASITSTSFTNSPLSASASSTASAPPPLPTSLSAESLHSEATQKTQIPPAKPARGQKTRPCDACRRRKSKCVINEGQSVCAACGMHGQKCTFVEDPRPRKRRVDADGQPADSVKRRQSNVQPHPTKSVKGSTKIKREDSDHSAGSSSAASVGNWQYHGSHIGYTTELEPMLFDISRGSAGAGSWGANYQKSDDRNAFLTFGSESHIEPRANSTQGVERLVGPHGPALLQHYQKEISRSFPIIEDASFSASQRKTLEPALLAAVYTVSASSPGYDHDRVKRHPLDIYQMEEQAISLLSESLDKPTLSTIQAGLLIMQRSEIDTKSLNGQLVGAAYELGLHLDCSTWTLSEGERGLRKRLAWAVYMQDQWCSLVHGRPSLIAKANWAVQDLYDEDFGITSENTDAELDERRRGQECFCEMVVLTEILSCILDAFYTQKAMMEYDDAGVNGTRLILERAKPVQMRLKQWFTQLPKTLKLENGQAPSIIGHLHLAYFATEITLHRCIIRSLAASSTDTYLTHICRSAAKTRLISAMDFVNRLRSDHLTSFWYFPSKVNFALVATFGSLLLATAPCQEEAEFYKARLGEYKWTLSVSAKNAGFLHFAIESLESSTDLLKSLPKKPKMEDLDVRQIPPPPLPPTVSISLPPKFAVGPGGEEDDEEGDDDVMDDADTTAAPPTIFGAFPSSNPLGNNNIQTIHSSNFETGFNFRMMSPVTESTEMSGMAQGGGRVGGSHGSNGGGGGVGGVSGYDYDGGGGVGFYGGPFSGTAFEGLEARDWFDNSHHGSPEAERMGLLS